MRCFVHADQEARGLCKVCGRGLCGDCAADLGHSLACRSRHEGQAEAVYESIQRSITLQRSAKRSVYMLPLFFAFMGMVFVITGWFEKGSSKAFTLSLGGGFVVFAAVVAVVNRRAFRQRSISTANRTDPRMPS